jgi:hypothetical protein
MFQVKMFNLVFRKEEMHKRSISTFEEDEIVTNRKEDGKIISPRMESVFQKYYEIFDKKKTTLTSSSEWKKGIASKYLNNKILKNEKTNKLINSTNSSLNYTSQKILKPSSVKLKGDSKTALNTKPSSRKNSIEKTIYGNSKNLFLINSKLNLKTSNNSNNNSSSTLLSNKYLHNHPALDEHNSNIIADNKKNHAKVNSELPLNSINLIEKKIVFKPTNDYKRKTGPISIPVTNKQSKNNSKTNSKSTSRIEEILDKNTIQQSKYSKVGKKTTTTSPTNGTREIISLKKDEKKIPLKLYLDINNIKKDKPRRDSFEGMLEASNDSILSTIRESHYYRKEAEKIASYIKQCNYCLFRFFAIWRIS